MIFLLRIQIFFFFGGKGGGGVGLELVDFFTMNPNL